MSLSVCAIGFTLFLFPVLIVCFFLSVILLLYLFLYLLRISFVNFGIRVPLILLILSSFFSLRFTVGSRIMPSSISLSLPIRSGLSRCCFTINFIFVPMFLFRIIISNSHFTKSSPCIILTIL